MSTLQYQKLKNHAPYVQDSIYKKSNILLLSET